MFSTSMKAQLTIDLPKKQKEDQWKYYESEEGLFKVLVPGPFTKHLDSITTEVGKLAYHTFLLQRDPKSADNVLYMVSYCDYPPYTAHSDSMELLAPFFDQTVEAATESVEGELLYSNPDFLGTFPGRFWRIDYLNGEAIIKTKAFLVENRYYSLQVITLKDKNRNDSVDRFFESFQLEFKEADEKNP